MKVMLVTPLFMPEPGGAAVYFDLLSKSLAQKQQVTKLYILSRYLRKQSIFEENRKICIVRLLFDLKYMNCITGFIQTIWTPVIILILSKILKVDLIHYHSLTSYKVIHYMSFLFGIPMVCDMRDLAAKNEGADTGFYRHATRIICCSENVCDFVNSDELLKTKSIYIPIPFESPPRLSSAKLCELKERYGIDPRGPYILFVGAVLDYKGIFELICAYKYLVALGYDWRLIIAGPLQLEGDAASMQKFLSAIKFPGISYLGPVERKDALGLIQGCDIFVLPSKTESLSRVCLEAISFGVKVVLPGCVPEFEKHCSEFVINTVSPVEIAKKLVLVSGADKLPKYPFLAHDPQKITDKIFSLYLEVLSPG